MTSRDLRSALADCAPVYEVPEDDLVRDVLIPGLSNAHEVCIGAGFFTSGALAQISPGLAALLEQPTGRVRLLVSPLLSSEDQEAIRSGLTPDGIVDAAVLTELIRASKDGSALERHCLDCLAYLVRSKRLEVRMVLMEAGFYHKKLWLLSDEYAEAAVHGSGNATARGLLVNGEQMSLDRPWNDGPVAGQRVAALRASFTRQWKGLDPRSVTLEAAQALDFLSRWNLDVRGGHAPTVADFFRAWGADHQSGIESVAPSQPPQTARRTLQVPPGLEFRNGQYAHQGRAVDALLAEGGGIVAIATGGGKTKTALIAATAFQDSSPGANLVFVVVPSRPLIDQWAGEIREFGVEPTILSGLAPTQRRREFDYLEAALRTERRDTTVLLCTTSLFSGEHGFRDRLRKIVQNCTLTLIADEVHNFGASRILAALPSEAKWRIGLSATPVRQYDPQGTKELYSYFGNDVFEFSVSDAISAGCLVPYKYFPHVVAFDMDEAEEFETLTDRIRQLGFLSDFEDDSLGDSDLQLETLLRRRRGLVEQARGKLPVLRSLLSRQERDLQRALFYCSAKGAVLAERRQIDEVNELLVDEGILFHQLTNEETGSRLADELLTAFMRGELQALTAMKVLDEGVDVPQTETAFILASSSVRREWVQRRGRVLRKAPGKTGAILHDFVVSPDGLTPQAGRSLLRSEVARVSAFGADSTNQYDRDGGLAVIARLEEHVYGS